MFYGSLYPSDRFFLWFICNFNMTRDNDEIMWIWGVILRVQEIPGSKPRRCAIVPFGEALILNYQVPQRALKVDGLLVDVVNSLELIILHLHSNNESKIYEWTHLRLTTFFP